MDKPRFFPEQAAPLRAMLEGYLRELGASAAGLPGLSLLLLGGGYGRGEGGIMRLDDSEALYNDLEFYLLVDSPSAAHRDWIGRQSEIGHRTTGIEVEFKALPVSALRRARPSMFYYDLLAAHLPVAGDPGVLQTLPENLSDPAAIPADEGTRLLMNRGCSLLVCARMADGTEPGAPGFIDRIAAKLKLALGDAMLCSDGLYHWSCRERDRRLHDWKANIPHRDQILAWHREAVDFKFHPRASGLSDSGWRAPLRDLRAVWCDAFLWLEGKRLGMRLDSPVSYASTRRALLPHEHPIANALRRIRLGAANRRLLPGSWMRHPRENVLRSLALLINPDRTPEDIGQAARILGCDLASQPQPVEDACRNLWRQFP